MHTGPDHAPPRLSAALAALGLLSIAGCGLGAYLVRQLSGGGDRIVLCLLAGALLAIGTAAHSSRAAVRENRQRREAEGDPGRRAPHGDLLHRATEALHDREARLRAVLDTAVDAIVTIDGRGIIDAVNPAVEPLFGYVVEEMLGRNVSLLMPAPLAQDHDSCIRRYLRSGSRRVIGIGREVVGRRKDGSTFPLWLSVSEFSVGGARRFTGIMHDMSALKVVQSELRREKAEVERANAELVRRNEELDSFAYLASHDLQEPLRKLISFSELLRRDVGEDLSARAGEDLEFIVSAARRMRDLIQALLTLSRASKKELDRAVVPLDGCLDRALDALSATIEERGAQIERGELPEVLGDGTLLTQLLQNLVGNAVKFVPADRPPQVRVTAEREGDRVTVSVADNGIGIEERHRENVFAPFKRLHGRGKFAGTGVGLAICQKAVERHGGRIWIESLPGEGSTFRFEIPDAA